MAVILIVLLIILEVCAFAILVLETIHHFWNIPALSNDTILFLNILLDILSCVSLGILLPLYLRIRKNSSKADTNEESSEGLTQH